MVGKLAAVREYPPICALATYRPPQVDELCDTLYKTNRTMVESERMLSEYHDVTYSQSREMDRVSV